MPLRTVHEIQLHLLEQASRHFGYCPPQYAQSVEDGERSIRHYEDRLADLMTLKMNLCVELCRRGFVTDCNGRWRWLVDHIPPTGKFHPRHG